MNTQQLRRRRVELACTRCRRKKGKCDGVRPICSVCSKDNVECSYQPLGAKLSDNTIDSRHEPKSTSYLRQRIINLEKQLAESQEASSGGRTDPALVSPKYTASTESMNIPDEETAVDTDATKAFSDATQTGGIGHFGPSSTHGYFRILSRQLAHFPFDNSSMKLTSSHFLIVLTMAARTSICFRASVAASWC